MYSLLTEQCLDDCDDTTDYDYEQQYVAENEDSTAEHKDYEFPHNPSYRYEEEQDYRYKQQYEEKFKYLAHNFLIFNCWYSFFFFLLQCKDTTII